MFGLGLAFRILPVEPWLETSRLARLEVFEGSRLQQGLGPYRREGLGPFANLLAGAARLAWEALRGWERRHRYAGSTVQPAAACGTGSWVASPAFGFRAPLPAGCGAFALVDGPGLHRDNGYENGNY